MRPPCQGGCAAQGARGGNQACSMPCHAIWEAGEAREDISGARVKRRGMGDHVPTSFHTLGQLASLASLSSLNDTQAIEIERKEATNEGDFILPDTCLHPPYPPKPKNTENKMGQCHG